MKVTVYQADDGWRWRCRAANGETLASGEAYKHRQDAEHAVNLQYGGNPDITIETVRP